jgi:hypothetical protein
MKSPRPQIAIDALRVVLGVVVLIQSFIFLFGGDSAKVFGRHGLPDAIRMALGWSEVIAAVLFLLPPTIVVGGWALLVVFMAAIAIHLLHGQFEVGGLLVYAAAVFAVMVQRRSRLSGSQESGTDFGKV